MRLLALYAPTLEVTQHHICDEAIQSPPQSKGRKRGRPPGLEGSEVTTSKSLWPRRYQCRRPEEVQSARVSHEAGQSQ